VGKDIKTYKQETILMDRKHENKDLLQQYLFILHELKRLIQLTGKKRHHLHKTCGKFSS